MILTYHQIEPTYSPRIYGVTLASLRGHLECVSAHIQSSRQSSVAAVTFDDGHISNYTYALPLLDEMKLRATFFIPAGFVETRQDVMTWKQLREVVAQGHSIGSHTWSHPMLTTCTGAQVKEELSSSRQLLQDKLGIAVDAISMPHGSWNDAIVHACKNAGYTTVYTSDFWRGKVELEEMKMLGRLTVRSTMTEGHILRMLQAGAGSLLMAAAPYIAKDKVRHLLGDRRYHALWGRLTALPLRGRAQ